MDSDRKTMMFLKLTVSVKSVLCLNVPLVRNPSLVIVNLLSVENCCSNVNYLWDFSFAHLVLIIVGVGYSIIIEVVIGNVDYLSRKTI